MGSPKVNREWNRRLGQQIKIENALLSLERGAKLNYNQSGFKMSLPRDSLPPSMFPRSSFFGKYFKQLQKAGTDAVVEGSLQPARCSRLHKCWLQGTGTKNLCAHLFGIYKSKKVQNETADNERAKRSSNRAVGWIRCLRSCGSGSGCGCGSDLSLPRHAQNGDNEILKKKLFKALEKNVAAVCETKGHRRWELWTTTTTRQKWNISAIFVPRKTKQKAKE